ncbi:SpoIIE family protein phosphatase [Streptomyces sp. Z26]|uniref:SpoIIE family protein phosphatase n=1 Tax=Streptomyces sp. Z26 TaxID=2500177 RepID=UPI001404CEB8|nr:SpoIIE family protein phosphatase [Streptomyces sp. Z26]
MADGTADEVTPGSGGAGTGAGAGADPGAGDAADGGFEGPYTSLQRAALRVLACTDSSRLLGLALDACLERFGSGHGVVYLLHDDGWLRLAAVRGYADDLAERFRTVSPRTQLPAAQSVQWRRPVFGDFGEYRKDYPHVELFRQPYGFAAFPLLVDDHCLGAALLQTDGTPPTPPMVVAATMITTACAHRLEHLLALGGSVETPGGTRLGRALSLIDSRTRKTRLELAMTGADIGFFEWDFGTGRITCDERLCRMLGVRPYEFDERIGTFRAALHPDDRRAFEAARAASLDSGRFTASPRAVHAGGAVRRLAMEGRVSQDVRRRPQGLVGIVRDRTEEHRREARDAARREFLLGVTRGVTNALSTQEVIDTAAARVLPVLGARTLALFVRERHTFEPAGSYGFEDGELDRMRAEARAVADVPELLAGLLRQPSFLPSSGSFHSPFPAGSAPTGALRAWATLPVVTQGTAGICVIGFARPHRFSEDDKALCHATAGVLAQAVDRSRVLDLRREQLTELQHLMLPGRVPDLPGLDVAVRYVPGSDGLEVGGDWYDVLPSGGDGVVVTVGDVQGHSAPAAAVMGHLRVAMQAYAKQGIGPGALLRHGNRILCDLDTERFATCTAVEVTGGNGLLRLARAGHAQPLLLEPDGRVRELPVAGGIPLGCFPNGERDGGDGAEAGPDGADDGYPVTEYPLPPGATLLLYTDGLVERRGEDYDASVRALADRLTRLVREDVPTGTEPGSLDALADALVAPARAREWHDDIALLLLRRRTA